MLSVFLKDHDFRGIHSDLNEPLMLFLKGCLKMYKKRTWSANISARMKVLLDWTMLYQVTKIVSYFRFGLTSVAAQLSTKLLIAWKSLEYSDILRLVQMRLCSLMKVYIRCETCNFAIFVTW